MDSLELTASLVSRVNRVTPVYKDLKVKLDLLDLLDRRALLDKMEQMGKMEAQELPVIQAIAEPQVNVVKTEPMGMMGTTVITENKVTKENRAHKEILETLVFKGLRELPEQKENLDLLARKEMPVTPGPLESLGPLEPLVIMVIMVMKEPRENQVKMELRGQQETKVQQEIPVLLEFLELRVRRVRKVNKVPKEKTVCQENPETKETKDQTATQVLKEIGDQLDRKVNPEPMERTVKMVTMVRTVLSVSKENLVKRAY